MKTITPPTELGILQTHRTRHQQDLDRADPIRDAESIATTKRIIADLEAKIESLVDVSRLPRLPWE